MDTGNIGRYVVSAVVGIVLFLVSLALFPIIQQNADGYLMVFQQRCTTDGGQGQNFKKLFGLHKDTGEIITNAIDIDIASTPSTATSVTCMPSSTDFAAGTTIFTALTGEDLANLDTKMVVDEHLEQVKGLTVTTAGQLEGSITKGTLAEPLEVTQFLSGLSQLIIRIVPILSVVSFLALSAASLFNYSMGSGAADVSRMIGMAIGGLIAIVVILNLAPTLFTGLNDAYAWTSSDRLTIMEQFGAITQLIVRFVPTIFTASVLTIVGAQNWLAYKNVKQAA